MGLGKRDVLDPVLLVLTFLPFLRPSLLLIFLSKQYPPLPFWRRVVRLRLFSLLCLALAVPALVSRVVTLRTYCHLDGKIEEEVEEASAFKVRREGGREGRRGRGDRID